MKITIEDIFQRDNILCFLNGEMQNYAIEADDEEGYVVRYTPIDGKYIEPFATEKVYGRLQFSYIGDTTSDDNLYRGGNIVFGEKFDKIQDLINYIKEK